MELGGAWLECGGGEEDGGDQLGMVLSSLPDRLPEPKSERGAVDLLSAGVGRGWVVALWLAGDVSI